MVPSGKANQEIAIMNREKRYRPCMVRRPPLCTCGAKTSLLVYVLLFYFFLCSFNKYQGIVGMVVFFYLSKERARGPAARPVPGRVFRNAGARFCFYSPHTGSPLWWGLIHVVWKTLTALPPPPLWLLSKTHTHTHIAHFFGVFVGQCALPSSPSSIRVSFIALIAINKREQPGKGPLPPAHICFT